MTVHANHCDKLMDVFIMTSLIVDATRSCYFIKARPTGPVPVARKKQHVSVADASSYAGGT